MNYSYIIIDDNQESISKIQNLAKNFLELNFLGSANNYFDGINLILEQNPMLIFLEIDPIDEKSNLSLSLINELYCYLTVIPKIIVTTTKKEFAFEAIQYEVTDYLLKPLQRIDLVKLIFKLKKSNSENEVFVVPSSKSKKAAKNNKVLARTLQSLQSSKLIEQPLILCIKSYGDYRYIDGRDICYFQADNNSTDIFLNNGDRVTAFKTLKHFECLLSTPFARIHNSYIVNRNYISRIQTGNAVCFIKNTSIKIPFSKSYKQNIDLIISEFANGNYLEI